MNMKWIWNEYEMTWSPLSTRWNTTQICLVFPSFMPLSALLVDQPKLLNTVQHLCDVLIQLTGPPRGEVCQSFRFGFRKVWWHVVATGGGTSITGTRYVVMCCLFICGRSTVKFAKCFWTLFLAVFDADCLVPFEWGPAQELNLNKPLVKVDGGQ